MTTPTRLLSTLACASWLAFTGAAIAQTVAQTVAREAVTEMPPKRADADPPEPESTGIVERVLDLQGISELSLEQLMDLPVVTASGKAEERSLAAANVFIVSRDDIERHGYRSLGEMLRLVPGMYLIYDYVGYSVGVREVTSGYRGGTRIVKVMIDGVPISFRPDLEAFLGPEFIPVEAIERVEIAKGPLSALYGANAFLATVNVITRTPEERDVQATQRFWHTNGNPGWGASALATHSGIDTALLLAVSYDRINRSGIQARPTYAPFQNPEQSALSQPSSDDIARPGSMFGRLSYFTDHLGEFQLEAGYQELDSKAEFLLNSQVTHRSRVNVHNGWGALHWRYELDKLAVRAIVAAAEGRPERDYHLFLTDNLSSSYKPRFDYRALNALVEASYDFGSWLSGDVGVDAELRREGVLYYRQTFYNDDVRTAFSQRDLISVGAPTSRDYRQVGPYLQLRSAPFPELPDFRFTLAARGDWIDFGPITYETQMSVRGAVAYRFGPALTSKLIVGRAFQTASGTLLFSHAGFGSSQSVLGTEHLNDPRGLDPQVVSSVELVVSSQPADFLSLEGAVFYQDLDDAIRFNTRGSLIVANNSGSVSTAGGELVAKLMFGHFRPYAAVSLTRQVSAEVTRDLEDIASFSGSPSMFPRIFGYIGCNADLVPDVLMLNAELYWAGARGPSQANYYQNNSRVYSLDPYQVLDVTLRSGGLPLLDRELDTRFSVSVRNALSNDYIEPGFSGVDIPQPDTSFLFQVQQEL
jgi:outer membrane receptor protein involved in Fe transport